MDYKKDFPIFNNRNITYLDSGATTQSHNMLLMQSMNFMSITMQTHTEVRILLA